VDDDRLFAVFGAASVSAAKGAQVGDGLEEVIELLGSGAVVLGRDG
jgi:hypothetical protein